MGTLKSFVLSVARIATVIVVVVVVLGVLGWGVYAIRQARQAASETSLGTPKKWGVLKIRALDGVELRLSSMWRKGSLHYQLSTRDYPPPLAAARESGPTRGSLGEPAWTLVFSDEHGFKVFEFGVPLSSMTLSVDSTGKGIALSTNDQTPVDAEAYRRASSWHVTWNFEAPRPAAITRARAPAGAQATRDGVKSPKWRDVSRWRQLKLGMSKEEVRQLLGEPESVTESGAIKVWYYGTMRQGEVDFDESDNVSFWSEPNRLGL